MARTISLFILTLFFSLNVQAEELKPLVERNVALVVSLVEQNKDLSVEALQPKMDEVLVNLVNFETIALGVMGEYRHDATAEQQAAFQQNFRTSLNSLFIKAFRAMNPKNINILDTKSKGNQGRVKMQVTGSDNSSVQLLFNLRKHEKGWLVVNFLIDGVNMGLAYRNVFDAKIKEYGDMDAVILRWNADIDTQD